jgi:hypothetical protein
LPEGPLFICELEERPKVVMREIRILIDGTIADATSAPKKLAAKACWGSNRRCVQSRFDYTSVFGCGRTANIIVGDQARLFRRAVAI